jgi:hypothetical protein
MTTSDEQHHKIGKKKPKNQKTKTKKKKTSVSTQIILFSEMLYIYFIFYFFYFKRTTFFVKGYNNKRIFWKRYQDSSNFGMEEFFKHPEIVSTCHGYLLTMVGR